MTPRATRIGSFVGCLLLGVPVHAETPGPHAASIDLLLAKHWRDHKIAPAGGADDVTLLRRVTLDLAGRIPTVRELDVFADDKEADRYARVVGRLVGGPEFAWHFGTVLDEIIQGRLAGSEPFVHYMRASLRENKGWDAIFREVLVGPWDTDARKPATGFLDRRVKDLDALTVDTTRAFFGVDISCARCHNHPLVPDWKRTHYYGMAAFFVRTTGGKGAISEKADGEAKFAGRDGKETVAPMMFLTGKPIDSPKAEKPAKHSRRDVLVRTALEEKAFLSRAFVNRLWEYFLGRGLVDPVDQIHSGNPASVPTLLDELAKDFAASGYDIRRLVTAIVTSRAYRLDGRWVGDKPPAPGEFAVARLRPLSPRQVARSFVIALGPGNFAASPEQLAALDKQAAAIVPMLDPRTADFQSSAREALFVSNSAAVRELVSASALTTRLTAIGDDRVRATTAIRSAWSRPPTAADLGDLESWLKRHPGDRSAASADLVWALVAAAEFRFNH